MRDISRDEKKIAQSKYCQLFIHNTQPIAMETDYLRPTGGRGEVKLIQPKKPLHRARLYGAYQENHGLQLHSLAFVCAENWAARVETQDNNITPSSVTRYAKAMRDIGDGKELQRRQNNKGQWQLHGSSFTTRFYKHAHWTGSIHI